MTFFKPNQENTSFLSRLTILLALPAILGVFWLVILHNQLVDVKHNLTQVNLEIQETQAQSAEIKDQIFSLLGNESLFNVKNTRGLIQEKNPDYFQTLELWTFASQ